MESFLGCSPSIQTRDTIIFLYPGYFERTEAQHICVSFVSSSEIAVSIVLLYLNGI